MKQIIIISLFIASFLGNAQKTETVYQTVKGVVYNSETQKPIANATIFEEEKPNLGVITDDKGKFTFRISTGRKTILFTHLGYQYKEVSFFLNTSQIYELAIFLEPSIAQLSEITIKKSIFQKEKTVNRLIYSSGRSFSTEEAYRYAGTLGDPARMARAYPGVIPSDDNRNDIVIRGNSPTGLLWRVDGIEIPNPNHYANVGLTGSTVTLLNPKMITNSDFISSAFPAEYGNATAGVFDVKLKKGNAENHEFRIGTGWSGLELAAEGPLSKKKNTGTYITSYRYSFLDLIDKIGLDFGILPKYQDLTTKLDFNLSEKLELSVFGLWATSNINLDARKNDPNIKTGEVINTGSDTYVGSAKFIYKPNYQTNYIFNFSINSSQSSSEIDEFTSQNSDLKRTVDARSLEKKYSFFTQFETYKIENNHLKIGVRADLFDLDFRTDLFDLDFNQKFIRNKNSGLETAVDLKGKKMNLFRTDLFDLDFNQKFIRNKNSGLETVVDLKGKQMSLFRMYAQDAYSFSKKLKATAGLHFQYLDLNNSYAIEPRGGISYRFNNRHEMSFAYGKHSQTQVRTLYFVNFNNNNLSNKNLDFSKANHYSFSYNWQLSKNLRYKFEAYYQQLYDIPIENNKTAIFSTINTGANYYVPLKEGLINEGKGRNYGLEMTLEKFFSNNYYFMWNSSFFQSEYKTLSNIWYDTEFDLDYITNAIWGKEFPINKFFVLGMDLKTTFAGGKPYTPILESASVVEGKIIYQKDAPFSKKYDPYFRTDLKFYYKMNTPKTYMTFAVDLQNLTNYKSIYSRNFNVNTGTYTTFYQQRFFPMFTFEVLF